MSEPLSVPASFLNVDLELEAPTDLTRLAESFGPKVFVLYCGEASDGFRLSVEPVIEGQLSGDPVACTEYFLDLLENLSRKNMSLWRSCKCRTFDYGFDGGLEENPFHISISPDHLARMAKLGIELRVTIYPFRAHEVDDDSQRPV